MPIQHYHSRSSGEATIQSGGVNTLRWRGSNQWTKNIVHNTLYLNTCMCWVVRRVLNGNGVPKQDKTRNTTRISLRLSATAPSHLPPMKTSSKTSTPPSLPLQSQSLIPTLTVFLKPALLLFIRPSSNSLVRGKPLSIRCDPVFVVR